jgi:alanine racemase
MLEAGATRLGVARVAEAIHLREAGVSAPIHVFTEPPPQAAGTLIDNDLTAAVYTESFGTALSEAAVAAGRTVPVHVKLDTGMHRVGLLSDDVPGAIERLAQLPGLDIEGIWSHLAIADIPDHPFTRKQLDLFAELNERIERTGIEIRYRHIANSAATLSMPETHMDLVRCGVASFGLWPGPALAGSADLRPVLSLKARVNMKKRVHAGEALSYGLRYEVEKDSHIVTVPAGYADGYDRRLSGRADVLLGQKRHKVSGTVCMDQFMVDVGDDNVEVGEVATLIGEGISAEELAEHIGTINYEVTTRIPSRVPRIYLEGTDGS